MKDENKTLNTSGTKVEKDNTKIFSEVDPSVVLSSTNSVTRKSEDASGVKVVEVSASCLQPFPKVTCIPFSSETVAYGKEFVSCTLREYKKFENLKQNLDYLIQKIQINPFRDSKIILDKIKKLTDSNTYNFSEQLYEILLNLDRYTYITGSFQFLCSLLKKEAFDYLLALMENTIFRNSCLLEARQDYFHIFWQPYLGFFRQILEKEYFFSDAERFHIVQDFFICFVEGTNFFFRNYSYYVNVMKFIVNEDVVNNEEFCFILIDKNISAQHLRCTLNRILELFFQISKIRDSYCEDRSFIDKFLLIFFNTDNNCFLNYFTYIEILSLLRENDSYRSYIESKYGLSLRTCDLLDLYLLVCSRLVLQKSVCPDTEYPMDSKLYFFKIFLLDNRISEYRYEVVRDHIFPGHVALMKRLTGPPLADAMKRIFYFYLRKEYNDLLLRLLDSEIDEYICDEVVRDHIFPGHVALMQRLTGPPLADAMKRIFSFYERNNYYGLIIRLLIDTHQRSSDKVFLFDTLFNFIFRQENCLFPVFMINRTKASVTENVIDLMYLIIPCERFGNITFFVYLALNKRFHAIEVLFKFSCCEDLFKSINSLFLTEEENFNIFHVLAMGLDYIDLLPILEQAVSDFKDRDTLINALLCCNRDGLSPILYAIKNNADERIINFFFNIYDEHNLLIDLILLIDDHCNNLDCLDDEEVNVFLFWKEFYSNIAVVGEVRTVVIKFIKENLKNKKLILAICTKLKNKACAVDSCELDKVLKKEQKYDTDKKIEKDEECVKNKTKNENVLDARLERDNSLQQVKEVKMVDCSGIDSDAATKLISANHEMKESKDKSKKRNIALQLKREKEEKDATLRLKREEYFMHCMQDNSTSNDSENNDLSNFDLEKQKNVAKPMMNFPKVNLRVSSELSVKEVKVAHFEVKPGNEEDTSILIDPEDFLNTEDDKETENEEDIDKLEVFFKKDCQMLNENKECVGNKIKNEPRVDNLGEVSDSSNVRIKEEVSDSLDASDIEDEVSDSSDVYWIDEVSDSSNVRIKEEVSDSLDASDIEDEVSDSSDVYWIDEVSDSSNVRVKKEVSDSLDASDIEDEVSDSSDVRVKEEVVFMNFEDSEEIENEEYTSVFIGPEDFLDSESETEDSKKEIGEQLVISSISSVNVKKAVYQGNQRI